MKYLHRALGSLAGGARFEVTLRGAAARVCLIDDENYPAFLDGEEFEYHGGFHDVGTVVMEVPYDGYWYLVVDSNARRITVQVSQIFD